jgi:hypothetical protein
MPRKPKHEGSHRSYRRAAVLELVMAGKIPSCVYCGGSLPPNPRAWQLCHVKGTSRYMGQFPEHFGHESCNKSAGARERKLHNWSKAYKAQKSAKSDQTERIVPGSAKDLRRRRRMLVSGE